jgi:ferritin-like protein
VAPRSDLELLEDLLARENRLLSAYEAALRRDAIDAAVGELLRDHEREHVRALEQTLAGRARNPRAGVAPPELNAALRSRDAFARYAMGLEDDTVAAYTEAAPAIGRPGLRQPLGSIMCCGAAHVVALRQLLGYDALVPYPGV